MNTECFINAKGNSTPQSRRQVPAKNGQTAGASLRFANPIWSARTALSLRHALCACHLPQGGRGKLVRTCRSGQREEKEHVVLSSRAKQGNGLYKPVILSVSEGSLFAEMHFARTEILRLSAQNDLISGRGSPPLRDTAQNLPYAQGRTCPF